jgi:hypothetical protein
MKTAAATTAASAEQSGTAIVQIRKDGEPWAGKTVRWNGSDLSLVEDLSRADARETRVVDGMMYAEVPGLGWAELGSPSSIDPDSGTTPAEYLELVREDVGGATFRTITDNMAGVGTREFADGSTLYTGTVPARLIARETGFKEGQAIRVLPFGYVAHGTAADPSSALDVGVVVGRDGVILKLSVSWPHWTYAVGYSDLGSTPAPVVPENVHPVRRVHSS